MLITMLTVMTIMAKIKIIAIFIVITMIVITVVRDYRNREDCTQVCFIYSSEMFIGRLLRSANKRLLADRAQNIYGHQRIAAIF